MNPFKYGQTVLKDDFCPRPNLERVLKKHIASGQNVVLQGERRCGKTSLICETTRKMKKVHLVYVDLLEIKSVQDICKRIIRALITMEQKSGSLEKILRSLSHIRPVITFDPVTGTPSISMGMHSNIKPDSIEALLDLIQITGKSKKITVAFDEFQDVFNLKESGQVLALMRSKIQFQSDIPYLYAGSVRNQMTDIFTNADSPFFKSALMMEVGPIEKKIFTNFLLNQFEKGKRNVDDTILDRVFEISNNSPGEVQQVCAALWEVSESKSKIGEEMILAAMQVIFNQELKGYESTLNKVSNQQLRCLSALSKIGGQSPTASEFLKETGIRQPGSVKKALNRLVDMRIIFNSGTEYKFSNPFFKHWLEFKDI